MVLKVFRWSPGFPERLQRFWVPAKEGMTVLDALVDAQRRLDPTLAFRYACRVGMCGSCAMVVNGRERWACRTLLKSLKSGIVTVRPLYHFPLVRDLVVDMAPLVEQTARVGGVFVPADGPQRAQFLLERVVGHAQLTGAARPLAQPEEQVSARRKGEEAGLVRREHVLPAPKCSRQLRFL